MAGITFTPKKWVSAGIVVAAASGTQAYAGLLSTIPAAIAPPQAIPTVIVPDIVSGSVGPNTETLAVEQFDDSLGMLQSVALTFRSPQFEGGLDAYYGLPGCEGTESEGGSCSIAIDISYSLFGHVGAPDGTSNAQVGSGGFIDNLTFTQDTNGEQGSQSVSPLFNTTLFDAFSPIILGTSPFSPYVGSGTWDLDFSLELQIDTYSVTCTADNGAICVDPVDVREGLAGSMTMYLTPAVTYEYMERTTPDVPSPGSLPLLAAGLGLTAWTRSRRPRKG